MLLAPKRAHARECPHFLRCGCFSPEQCACRQVLGALTQLLWRGAARLAALALNSLLLHRRARLGHSLSTMEPELAAADADISFDVDMPSFLARHDLEWDFQWVDGDPHIPCVSCYHTEAVDTP